MSDDPDADDVVLPDPDDDQVDDDDDEEPCEADADDFVAGELQKRLWLKETLPYLKLVTPDMLDDAEAKSFSRLRVAAFERAARIFRSDMIDRE